jgi:hypothetical protein
MVFAVTRNDTDHVLRAVALETYLLLSLSVAWILCPGCPEDSWWAVVAALTLQALPDLEVEPKAREYLRWAWLVWWAPGLQSYPLVVLWWVRLASLAVTLPSVHHSWDGPSP